MNEHESIRGMLALAAAGALSPEESRKVERHTSACEACRRELETWGAYTYGLGRVPQPSVPAGLVERTQARILREQAAAADRRQNELILGAVSVFAWIAGLAFWILIRVFTGGVWNVLGANLANMLTWSLVSTVLVWITAAGAVVMLGRVRRTYEPV